VRNVFAWDLDPVNTQLNIVRDQTDGTEGSYQSKVLRTVKKVIEKLIMKKNYNSLHVPFFNCLLPYTFKIILFLMAFFVVLKICLGEIKWNWKSNLSVQSMSKSNLWMLRWLKLILKWDVKTFFLLFPHIYQPLQS